jgi:hypothetical protein
MLCSQAFHPITTTAMTIKQGAKSHFLLVPMSLTSLPELLVLLLCRRYACLLPLFSQRPLLAKQLPYVYKCTSANVSGKFDASTPPLVSQFSTMDNIALPQLFMDL